jgi:hypothetical protein
MTYLPDELPSAKVLITVKTYPLPSRSYTELVCTAGLLNGKKWIRMYPIPFRFLQDQKQYPKYSWVEVDLVRNTKDFRPETYRLKNEKIVLSEKIGTSNAWAARKSYVLKETFTSMNDLIKLAKGPEKKSLATMKPKEIVKFEIEEDEREWRKDWLEQMKQMDMFESENQTGQRKIIRKLPYKFYYHFLTEGDEKPRRLMIEDWEIGALFWHCLSQTDSDEDAAKQMVKQKYFNQFVQEKDLYLFLGSTLSNHNKSRNPFMIIGVFYPPKSGQPLLF